MGDRLEVMGERGSNDSGSVTTATTGEGYEVIGERERNDSRWCPGSVSVKNTLTRTDHLKIVLKYEIDHHNYDEKIATCIYV